MNALDNMCNRNLGCYWNPEDVNTKIIIEVLEECIVVCTPPDEEADSFTT